MANLMQLKASVVSTDQIEVTTGKKKQFASLSTIAAGIQSLITALGSITATQVTGNLVGNVTGNVVGQHRHSTQTLTATGAVTLTSGVVLLSHASTIIAATKAAPTAGDELYIINSSASGTAAHTVTLPVGVTWDGTNRVATLDAPGEALHVIAISATRFFILENIGTVAFS